MFREPKLFSNFQNFPFFPSESFRGYRENMYTAAVFFRRPPHVHTVQKNLESKHEKTDSMRFIKNVSEDVRHLLESKQMWAMYTIYIGHIFFLFQLMVYLFKHILH